MFFNIKISTHKIFQERLISCLLVFGWSKSHLKSLLLLVLIYFEKPLTASYESISSPWECVWDTNESDCSLFKTCYLFLFLRVEISSPLRAHLLGSRVGGKSIEDGASGKQETSKKWVWSLGQEDALEEGMATHSSIFAWRIPWTEEADRLWFIGLQRVEHD